MTRVAPPARPLPRLAAPLLLLLLTTACEHVDAVHPLDPRSPPDQQATATLRGQLLVPADAPADLFTASTVLVRPGDAADAPTASAQPGADGRFSLPSLRPGAYVISAEVPGFLDDPRAVSLSPGETLDLGPIGLRRADPLVVAALDGRALLEGRGPGEHAGVVVAADPGGATVTGPDGRFHLDVAPGRLTLSLVYPGFSPQVLSEITARAGETTTLEAPVVLPALPGSVRGEVALRRFATPDRLGAVTLRLTPTRDPAADPRGLGVDTQGRFALADLPPDRYLLSVAAPGYDRSERPVTVAPGAESDLGVIELSHASSGPNAVALEGDVRLADNAPPAGVPVTIRLADAALTYALVATDLTGRFTVAAAADEAYALQVSAPGYAPMEAGPFTYAPDRARFEDAAGARPLVVLSPLP